MKSDIPTNADLPMDDLGQAAFTAYVDAAQRTEHPHERLANGSRAATLAVVGVLREAGLLRAPIRRKATHGTTGGYKSGCRCKFCRDAISLYERAVSYNNKIRGHNKV